MEKLIEKALSATRESKSIEFKSRFDVTSNQDWCELIKDIIAMSNSGGGIILLGVADDGGNAAYDPAPFLDTDAADVSNKISKYTGTPFSDFEVLGLERTGGLVAAIAIGPSAIPIVFRKPGTYELQDRQQRTSFKEGTIYFRHGAKSAPGTSDDLLKSFQAELDRVKKSWLQDIGKIVRAPPESEVLIVSKDAQQSAGGRAAIIRLTTDPNAPIYGKIDVDVTHPFRQKEVIAKVKEELPGVVFNSHDFLSIRYAHWIADHPEFQHKPKFGSPQYSQALVDWIVSSYKNDKNFFNDAREQHSALRNM
jgi:hypothetical protein